MADKRDRTAYIREWRKTPAGMATVKEQGRRERARLAAYKDLALQYPEEYERLLAQYMKTTD